MYVHRSLRIVWDAVDLFIAPSRYLRRRFHDEFGLPERKRVYLGRLFMKRRYGFEET